MVAGGIGQKKEVEQVTVLHHPIHESKKTTVTWTNNIIGGSGRERIVSAITSS